MTGTDDPATPDTLIEIVPEPGEVRTRLARTLRETKILRQLLRVSERAARERQADAPGAAEGGGHAH